MCFLPACPLQQRRSKFECSVSMLSSILCSMLLELERVAVDNRGEREKLEKKGASRKVRMVNA